MSGEPACRVFTPIARSPLTVEYFPEMTGNMVRVRGRDPELVTRVEDRLTQLTPTLQNRVGDVLVPLIGQNPRPCGWFRLQESSATKTRATMRARSGEVSIASGVAVGLVAVTLGCFPFSARAQPADLVLCDRLAADPADPDKPSDIKGIPEIAQSDLATAIKFCKTASNGPRRALYQLGRAYAANKQTAEAVSAYRRAADKGSTSAMVELGVLLATGSGIPKDEVQARKLFER